MAFITNGTATSTASDALAAGHSIESCVIHAEGDLRFQIDGDAGSAAGEVVKADASVVVNNLNGKRISVYAASSSAYSIRPALY